LAEAKSERFNFDRANDGDSDVSEELMAYGINRFLTTHTGSLPRPDDLIRAMFAKEGGRAGRPHRAGGEDPRRRRRGGEKAGPILGFRP
jgi:hypothetical protein